MSRTFKKRDNKKFKKSRVPADFETEQEGKYVPRKRVDRFTKKRDYWED